MTSKGPGSAYLAVVQAWTGSGLYSEASKSFRVVNLPPGPGAVTVLSVSTSSLAFYVSAFADPNPLAIQYEISVGKNAYGADSSSKVVPACQQPTCTYRYDVAVGAALSGTIFWVTVRAGAPSLSYSGSLHVTGAANEPVVTCPAPYNQISDGGFLTLQLNINGAVSNPVTFWRRDILDAWNSPVPQCGLHLTNGSQYRLSDSMAVISWTTALSNVGFFRIKAGNTVYVHRCGLIPFQGAANANHSPQFTANLAGFITQSYRRHLHPNDVPIDLLGLRVLYRDHGNKLAVRRGTDDHNRPSSAMDQSSVSSSHPDRSLSTSVRVTIAQDLRPLGTSQYVGTTDVALSWTGTFVAEGSKALHFFVMVSTAPMTATNGSMLVGLQTIEYSAAFISDISPLDSGTVHIGATYLTQDIAWQSTMASIDFFLKGWTDHISGIYEFAYRICSSKTCEERISVGLQSSNHIATPGVAYWVSVQAANGARQFIDIDCRHGTAGVNQGFVTAPVSNLALNWQATGLYAPIKEFSIQLGTTPGGGQIMPPTNVGNQLSFRLTDLALTHNTVLYATVQATSASGLKASKTLTGIHTNFIAPVASAPLTVISGTGYEMATGMLNVTCDWGGVFSDPESPIDGFQWAVGTAGLPSLYTSGFVDAGMSTSASFLCTSAEDSHFVVTVRATNRAGLTTEQKSDPILKSAAPPPAFSISALNEEKVDHDGLWVSDRHHKLTKHVAQFTGFANSALSFDGLGDPVSGLSDVQFQIVDATSNATLSDWTSIGVLPTISVAAADSNWLFRPLYSMHGL
ncbi:hypothetical protein HDU88_007891 [Geranomyces variabilis]|nr:hypothetical protein HDU88_007891 [Geranomyces variabilis]